MTIFNKILKNLLVSLISLSAACAIGFVFQWIDVEEYISTIFVFAVFIISLHTDGYICGILSAIVSPIVINFMFTYPFLGFDFITPVNIVSAVIMLAIAVFTGMMTTKVKTYEEAKVEGEREKMRANLLRAVSHDLRTPLTSIYSASSLLRDGKETLSEEQKETILTNIQTDSEWLIRMVENLLSVTRIDNETMKINKTPIILDELIDSSIAKFRKRYPEQDVDVTVPSDIVVVAVDSILIEQVILNLLENSVYHADGMTKLSLRVLTTADNAVFEVEDNGCGIDESKLKNLFAGGSAEHRDMAGPKRYAGIGLSVCATIIKAHGGTITAENRKDGGALFRFTLKKEKNTNDKQ